jgi:hypothetical protein
MRKSFLIHEEIRKCLFTLQTIPSEFHFLYEENLIFFFISVLLVTFVYLHVLWTASIALPEAGTVQQVGVGAELHAITTVPAR